MESHDHHQSMPGYSPRQLLHQGCGECDARSRETAGGLDHLDPARFMKAWQRAAQWQAEDDLPDLDPAEIPVLRTLGAVQRQLEKFGIPIGTFPWRLASAEGRTPEATGEDVRGGAYDVWGADFGIVGGKA